MNTPNLRAFLYDSKEHNLEQLVHNIQECFEEGIGASVIDLAQPKHIVDQSIVTIDPDEVVTPDSSYRRDLAIFETPRLSVVSLTSGTTSKPKAVVHNRYSLRHAVVAIEQVLELEKDDTWLLCLSPQYIAGTAIIARAFLLEQKIYSSRPDLASIKEAIEKHKPNLISLVPTQLKMLVDDGVDLSGFKAILVGGANADAALIERCHELGYNVHRTYGMTETFGGICHDGILFPENDVDIVNGEVYIQSSSIFIEYRHDFELTRSKFEGRYYKTGDLGSLDNNGKLSITGRIDDIVISGGVKINPVEIENALKHFIQVPFIAGGKQHEKWGQALSIAFENEMPSNIKLNDIRELLKKNFNKKSLPLQTTIIESFVRTESGKIKRKDTLEKSTVIEEHK